MTLGETTVAPLVRPAAHRTAYRLAATGLLLWTTAAAVSGIVRLTFGARPVFVHIRWSPGIDPGEQRRVEARYHLSLGEQLEGRMWGGTCCSTSP